ncbi:MULTISPECIES: sorbitol dehydrogenase family protein [Janthinobacterium]|uniref:Sorbitol dehydrogenase family protein n=1 Tax=Janthinobacterium rivuli TaxID=2751478 RepID=A0ABY8I0K7_9BURK|nr:MULTISPECIES: sorbitol dehydrogenase family protein [Janthinobacterium]WFR77497.1 sorbitol dehydrogenase family protein [Janthinobacterium rivuli]
MDATYNKEGRGPLNPGRRMVLAGLLSVSAAALIPWALAEPVANAEEGAFLAVSAVLVGRQALDPDLAQRLYKALVAQDAAFPAHVRTLLALINAQGLKSAGMQAALDAAQSPVAALPRQIASAWYLGIVGTGEAAVCVAYEEALNAAVVADVLVPPSYSYGAYGSWARKPI